MNKDKDNTGNTINYKRSYLFPKTLAKCIEQVTRPALKTQGLAGSKIISEWDYIVGNKLASHCLPQKLSFPAGKKIDGTLSIAVENGFATELQHLQPLILERLATYFGYKAVTRITICHTYVTKQEQKPAPSKKPVLLTDCTDFLDNVEDSELRKALTSIAKTLSGG